MGLREKSNRYRYASWSIFCERTCQRIQEPVFQATPADLTIMRRYSTQLLRRRHNLAELLCTRRCTIYQCIPVDITEYVCHWPCCRHMSLEPHFQLTLILFHSGRMRFKHLELMERVFSLSSIQSNAAMQRNETGAIINRRPETS